MELRSPDGITAAQTKADAPPARCAFTVDVEDWFQANIDFAAPITERVVRNTQRILDLLHEHGVRGTFFVQGLVARQFPRLVQDIAAQGHEVQSHGHTHRPLYAMDPAALRDELREARQAIEDACGRSPTAFRAPDFSILRGNLWALEILAEAGFEIDSSVFPMRLRRYGIGRQPLEPHWIDLPKGMRILEAPVTVWQIGPGRIPVAGGGYFRLLPFAILGRAFGATLAAGRPVIIYCHPYEFSPTEMEEYRGRIPRHLHVTQGLGRHAFAIRMRRMVETFSFGRLDAVLERWRMQTQAGPSRFATSGLTGMQSVRPSPFPTGTNQAPVARGNS